MISDLIKVKSDGTGLEKALEETEKFSQITGISKKGSLHLRLLCEELMGLVRAISGDCEASYRIENDNNTYKLSITADTEMYMSKRKSFISISTKGENSAAKGFMGKIRDIFEIALSKDDEGLDVSSIGLIGLASPGAYRVSSDAISLSFAEYKNQEDGEKKWDELEKSIVANIADEIEVFIKGDNVKLVITITED